MNQQQIQLPPDIPVTLTMTLNDTNKVLAGLGYLPMRDALDLATAIKQQGDAQAMEWLSKNTPAPDAPQAPTTDAAQ
jgi:hypothetical protein